MEHVDKLISQLRAHKKEEAFINLAVQKRVRTQIGALRYGEPIGTVITNDMINRAKKNKNAPKDVQGSDEKKSNPRGNPGGDEEEKDRSTLKRLLVSHGADDSKAAATVSKVSSAQLPGFLARLKQIKKEPSSATPTTGIPDPEGKKSKKDKPDVRIIHWRGQEIEVPRGARVGQVSPKGKEPAKLYWYNPTTGEVAGVDATGKNVAPKKLPAGQSLAKFFGAMKGTGKDDEKKEKK